MTGSDWMIVLAIISGPIIAVQVQKRLEDWQEKRRRKMFIFETLMTTRGNTVSERHVEALNMIDLEFGVKSTKEKKVVDAWKVYRDHLGSGPQDYEDSNYQAEFRIWAQKSPDLLTDLMFCMADILGYDFDKVQLKKGCYAPQGHADLEMEHRYIRRGLLNVLYGRAALPIQSWQAASEDSDDNSPQ